MFTHGVMFHHFYDNKIHIKEQGAITGEEFELLLEFYQKDYKILSADEYSEKARKNQLKAFEVCITFDDALKCQFDIAYPILESRGIKAFWFLYTSPLTGVYERLEIYRHFRFSKFMNIEEFYLAFFQLVSEYGKELKCDIKEELKNFQPNNYMRDFTFYTPNDKRFRYLRDDILKEEKYNYLMDKMIEKYSYDIKENGKILWLSKENIRTIYNTGHIIGLHSHTHPMVLTDLSFEEQYQEYYKNKEILEEIIGEKIYSVSYPCNCYNEDTIEIMKKLSIYLGFRANMKKVNESRLEISIEDHANIMRRMKER